MADDPEVGGLTGWLLHFGRADSPLLAGENSRSLSAFRRDSRQPVCPVHLHIVYANSGCLRACPGPSAPNPAHPEARHERGSTGSSPQRLVPRRLTGQQRADLPADVVHTSFSSTASSSYLTSSWPPLTSRTRNTISTMLTHLRSRHARAQRCSRGTTQPAQPAHLVVDERVRPLAETRRRQGGGYLPCVSSRGGRP